MTHWHYATSMPARHNVAIIETTIGPETDLTRDQAKLMLQPMIRAIQGEARYEDPDDKEKLWEPADWWMHHEPLQYLSIPPVALMLFAVFPCNGDCVASGIAFRDGLAEEYRKRGIQVDVQSAN